MSTSKPERSIHWHAGHSPGLIDNNDGCKTLCADCTEFVPAILGVLEPRCPKCYEAFAAKIREDKQLVLKKKKYRRWHK